MDRGLPSSPVRRRSDDGLIRGVDPAKRIGTPGRVHEPFPHGFSVTGRRSPTGTHRLLGEAFDERIEDVGVALEDQVDLRQRNGRADADGL